MRISSLSLVLALACLVSSVSVHAFPRAQYPAATKIYFSGSTSLDDSLELVFVLQTGGICDALLGNIDIWRASKERVITCFVSNDNTPGHGFATRAGGGTRIAFHKESRGGSSNAVNPLIAVSKGQAHALRWLDLSLLTNDCTTTNIAASPPFAAYIDHSGCALLQTPVDTAASAAYDVLGGISDVEPILAFPMPSAADLARLNVAPLNADVFGVTVTTNLYRALQLVRYGAGSACVGVDMDLPTCVPSFSKSQLSALFEQHITDWNMITNSVNVPLPAILGVVAPAGSDVRICRSVATSGSQAAAEVYFMGERCGSQGGFASPDDNSSVTDTVYVPNDFVNGSLVNAAVCDNDLRTCLASANTNGFWALGVQSTAIRDSKFNLATSGFRFVGINGAEPTHANVANGCYDFYMESVLTRIQFGPGALAEGDVRREVIEVVDEKLSDTLVLAQVNTQFDNRPWGNGGLLSLPGININTPAYSPVPEMSGFPMNTQTRFGNSCNDSAMVEAQPFGVCCD